MKDPETSPSQLEKEMTTAFTVNEITTRCNVLYDEETKITSNKDIPREEMISLICATRNNFIETLLKEKVRFDKIFRTSNGSLYFQLQSGEVLRMKNIPTKDEFSAGNEERTFQVQPIMSNLFFISRSEMERISIISLQPGEQLQTVPYEQGAVPFDINKRGYPSQIVFEIDNNGILTLKGTVFRNEHGNVEILDDQLVGGYHRGHPITNVIV
jgi:hypothetical protein